jgi:hypothetical protein
LSSPYTAFEENLPLTLSTRLDQDHRNFSTSRDLRSQKSHRQDFGIVDNNKIAGVKQMGKVEDVIIRASTLTPWNQQ